MSEQETLVRRLVEEVWNRGEVDQLSVLQQLGVISTPGETL